MNHINRSWGRHLPLAALIVALPLILLFNAFLILLMLFSPGAWRFDKADAKRLLGAELAKYREMPYEELTELLITEQHIDVRELTSQAAGSLQVEIQGFWDDAAEQNLRVLGSIDNGGLRAYCPVTRSFIMRPDGSVVE